MQDPKADNTIARVLDEAQQRQHILDVCGIQKFQPAELHERNVATSQLDLQRTAMRRCPEQHRLMLELIAFLAVCQDLLDDVTRLIRFVTNGNELRLVRRDPFGPRFLVKRSFARPITPLAADSISCVER